MSESEKKLTDSAKKALELARQHAEFLGQTYIGTEHMVLGILLEGKSAAAAALQRQNISAQQLLRIIEERIGRGTRSRLGFSDLSHEMQSILAELFRLNEQIGCKQILLRILRTPKAAGRIYLKEAGCDMERLQEMLNNLQMEEANNKTVKRARDRDGVLRKYSTDLTELAREHKLDPVVGREAETEQVIRVLSRRSKNNPCLVGEAGVGKTAVVEGLAQRIVEGTVPEQLQGKRILSMDMTALLAGSKFRGEFEERIQQCLAETLSHGDIIWFIDEMHILSEAGSAEGATSAANLLKPQLARGDLQVIGATTWSEHKRFIEKDAALARRFQKIMVEEPDEEKALEMLLGLCSRYEEHHGVHIPWETVQVAVKLSARYLPERHLPDKALDLLDEACAQAAQNHLRLQREQQNSLQKQMTALDEEKRKLLKRQDLPAAAQLNQQEAELQRQLMDLQLEQAGEAAKVQPEDIAALIAQQTGIELCSITQHESEKLRQMEKHLSRQVMGQEQAVRRVADAIRCNRAGLSDPKRPVGSFLFLGPSGVGKTELCRALAKELFGKEDAMIRLDMSEFSQEHMVSRLIGAPPGYVGYQEGGRLTEAVRQKPYSLLLFDELEKAHPRVYDLLLQLLEEGELKDGEGKTISFRSCVIIMTSNIGAASFQNPNGIGFEQQDDAISYERAAAKSKEELKKHFRPEFINRIDEIVVFRWLDEQALQDICHKMMEELQLRLAQQNLTLTVSKEAVAQLCKEAKEQNMGARPLRRGIRHHIENPLAQRIVNGDFTTGDHILCHWEQGEFQLQTEQISQKEELLSL